MSQVDVRSISSRAAKSKNNLNFLSQVDVRSINSKTLTLLNYPLFGSPIVVEEERK